MEHCLILGCGYTGVHVARRLLGRGIAVTATTRDPRRQADLQAAGGRVGALDVSDEAALSGIVESVRKHSSVLLSIPSLKATRNGIAYREDPTARIVEALGKVPARVVYLSTTGVYGKTKQVDERTPIAPTTERQLCRAEAERAVAKGPWPSLILRPAAIYGPGRGIHLAIKTRYFRILGSGDNFISRIHVEDLAALVIAALESDMTGSYPAADERPCTAREIAYYCADLLSLPAPRSSKKLPADETRRVDRQVDGRAICRLLGVKLRYPSYREGIAAIIEKETAK